jgi:enamine deaminase RidA (YjgF/YER057c/UK114 family)
MRRRVVARGAWAGVVGYSRAVRAGGLIEVAGTAAVAEDGGVIAPGDPYEQTRAALAIVEDALRELGAGLGDVVRTRIYVRDVADWEDVGRAHGEAFEEIRPASSMIQAAMVHPDMLVEIEATAVVDA